MKILLLNTPVGLKPQYDEDYEEKKKLRIGETYLADIKVPRNLGFHRKYFALINCAWDYQPEKVVEHFRGSSELFRKSVEIAAGHCDPAWSIGRSEWIEQAKSIAFDKMSDDEFGDLYDRVKDVLFAVFLRHITEEEFMSNLANF